ncbi:hypothetical protein V8E36_009169 [Tilletia maclaganii]
MVSSSSTSDRLSRRPQTLRHSSSALTSSSFLSSLRSLSFDKIEDLPASITAKQTAVQSNLTRLAVQHIDSVLDARDAVASLPALRSSLRAKLRKIQGQAIPQLSGVVADVGPQAQPAILKYQRSDTLAKTIADEEALTLLLHAPVTVKNLVSAATKGGALLGGSGAGTGGEPSTPGAERASDDSTEGGSQAASAALSITMRIYALAAEGSVLLSSSSSSPARTSSAWAQPSDSANIEAAGRSLHSIASEAIMHLHSLKLFLIQRTLHDAHLKLGDAIRVVTLIRHMRALRPQAIGSTKTDQDLAGVADRGASASKRPDEVALEELGLPESHLILAFFQARASVLRGVLASPPSSASAVSPPSPSDDDAISKLLTWAEPGPTTWCISAWKEQVKRTLSIARTIFDQPQTEARSPNNTTGSASINAAPQNLRLVLQSAYCSFAVWHLSDSLEEVESDGRRTVKLRRRPTSELGPASAQAQRKPRERIMTALHLYIYSIQ